MGCTLNLRYIRIILCTFMNEQRGRLRLWQIIHFLDCSCNEVVTPSTAMKFLSKFFWKWSFFDQNQPPLKSVEPFERILRALFISQCLTKFIAVERVSTPGHLSYFDKIEGYFDRIYGSFDRVHRAELIVFLTFM